MAVRLTFTNLDSASIDVIVGEEAAYIIADRISELTEKLTREEVLDALDATNVNVNINRYHTD